ncbi:hypothetical protein MMC17_004251 [Xylographa soralifera]|nr:hypothetical protein [Xylographa soralifera]
MSTYLNGPEWMDARYQLSIQEVSPFVFNETELERDEFKRIMKDALPPQQTESNLSCLEVSERLIHGMCFARNAMSDTVLAQLLLEGFIDSAVENDQPSSIFHTMRTGCFPAMTGVLTSMKCNPINVIRLLLTSDSSINEDIRLPTRISSIESSYTSAKHTFISAALQHLFHNRRALENALVNQVTFNYQIKLNKQLQPSYELLSPVESRNRDLLIYMAWYV